jgi:hypothetical protein
LFVFSLAGRFHKFELTQNREKTNGLTTENIEINIILQQQRALFALAAIMYKHVTIVLWNI